MTLERELSTLEAVFVLSLPLAAATDERMLPRADCAEAAPANNEMQAKIEINFFIFCFFEDSFSLIFLLLLPALGVDREFGPFRGNKYCTDIFLREVADYVKGLEVAAEFFGFKDRDGE